MLKKSFVLSVIFKFLILLFDLPIIEERLPNDPILFFILTLILAIKSSFFEEILSHETFKNF